MVWGEGIGKKKVGLADKREAMKSTLHHPTCWTANLCGMASVCVCACLHYSSGREANCITLLPNEEEAFKLGLEIVEQVLEKVWLFYLFIYLF